MSLAPSSVEIGFSVTSVAPMLGSEIVGLDVSRPLDAQALQAVREAFQTLENRVKTMETPDRKALILVVEDNAPIQRCSTVNILADTHTGMART